MTGIRHFVSGIIEYSAGAALESSNRKIPFFSLSVSPDKPTKKNKVPDLMQANVICDTGAGSNTEEEARPDRKLANLSKEEGC